MVPSLTGTLVDAAEPCSLFVVTTSGPACNASEVGETRRAAKVLLVDEHSRVLLFSGIDRSKPDVKPWWFAVGGALEDGEDVAAGATRELPEETGLAVDGPGPPLFTRRFSWDFEGIEYEQEETYFLVRTRAFEPVAAGWSETEVATMRGHRWWSIDDLQTTKEVVYPENLGELLVRLLGE